MQLAATRTGVDFDYLLAQARLESGLNPNAAATTSSARGLYQFTRGTWLDTVRKHGAEHGLGWAADALKAGADPATRAAILDLRRDPEASASMAAAFASDNAAYLQARIGREPNATDLYMAHFLGPHGAARFLNAKDADPGAVAAAAAPAAAVANVAVFTARGGRARTLAEVYDRFTTKLALPYSLFREGLEVGAEPLLRVSMTRTNLRQAARARTQPLPEAGAGQGNYRPQTGNKLPQAARLAYLLLAELGA